MVNIDCQSSSFLFDNPSRYLPKMNSSTNLYDCLTTFKIRSHTNDDDDDDDDDDDLLITTSPTAMTSSDSSDSAIVSDDIDDFDLINEKQSICRNSWPKILEKNNLTIPTTFASLSQSFDILNQLEQQTIPVNPSHNDQQKYKRPLPWFNSSPSSHNYTPPLPLDVPSNKVFNF